MNWKSGGSTRRAFGWNRLSACFILIGFAFFLNEASPQASLIQAQTPALPVWPSPVLVDDLESMLLGYYNQQADSTSPSYRLAPRFESEKALAAKDPDSLWEHHVQDSTKCHEALSASQFVDCSGHRLAQTFVLPGYAGGLELFQADQSYYLNDAIARIALFYAMYHAFLHDFDTTIPAGSPALPAQARQSQDYHRNMIRAYEAHARHILMRMFRDTRSDASFQLSMTRALGQVELQYLPIVTFLEQNDAWGSNRDRRNAFSVVNAMNQRIFWEWVWTQTNGPATAGFVNLGSQATYDSSRPANGILDGTDRFVYEFSDGPEEIPSLRSAAMDDPLQGGIPGLFFDADYPIPGEWWCYGTYGLAPSDALSKCIEHAARSARAGSLASQIFTPFGQYYGNPGSADPCGDRSYSESAISCGDTNLGSIAEEWLWTLGGARGGLYLIEQLSKSGDLDLPARSLGRSDQLFAIGQSEALTAYAHLDDRVGYGVAGFHGGEGRNDDLEWLWSHDGQVRAIRTLSAGIHDGASQHGRTSVGETDLGDGDSADTIGNTWLLDQQEYPGGIENHSPGPSSLYGTALFNLMLADRTGDRSTSSTGLASSLFDDQHRNHVEEFQNWIWLYQASYHRCPPADPNSEDPASAACFDASATKRRALYQTPDIASPTLRFDYLWRNSDPIDATRLIATGHAAEPDTTCTGRAGVPWRSIYNRNAAFLGQPESAELPGSPGVGLVHDEGGFGAYNELLQGMGGSMRLIAERYPLQPENPDYEAERIQVLKPWYDQMHTEVSRIFDIYANGLGYIPDVENSTCMGIDPGEASNPSLDAIPDEEKLAMISWQQGTGASVKSTTIRRANWYSIAAVWYWWYDSHWLSAGQ